MRSRPISKPIKVIVVGGGAAGFFGAIAAAEQGSDVTLIETARKPLAKVKISGGGRCNVTHACFDPHVLSQNYPRGGNALRGAFSRFQPQQTISWFESRGVKLKTEADGRIFPVSDNSETIVQCLIQSAESLGVKIWTGVGVRSVRKQPLIAKSTFFAEENDQDLEFEFLVELQSGQHLNGDRLLLATGSHPSGFEIARSLGHEIIKPLPSLFTFNISDRRLEGLAGVSADQVKIKLIDPDLSVKKADPNLEQTGAVLITHWGLSGPAVLKLSAWGARWLGDRHYQAHLQINWLPELSTEAVRSQLNTAKSALAQRLITGHCLFKQIPRRLWQSLLAAIAIDSSLRWADISKKQVNQLLTELTQGQYTITGKGVFKEEFVTCGGVNLKEVEFKTMESRKCPHLYLAGEILDIDGVTGGFNFQSAWTTGWLAGQAIA
ncbi:flavoprotein, HI0933 family [Synechococcus sp. PCC 7502]|uniref:NAD(P)/FAD-dependent oxidoreductase n=1 Tax=Synechococcus sp. PCC 7502 TaxID=1173263 RepID=UPI00029FB7CE|nr:NAD(P)/FAD-dependent oxidoreductase [Synechococcus sp. PCC 7502]AFY73489.1 flavoprotein, HI0933 family [Synechococcus sp. PCC 7502]